MYLNPEMQPVLKPPHGDRAVAILFKMDILH